MDISSIIQFGTSGLAILIGALSVTLITRFLQKGQVESSLTRKEIELIKAELRNAQLHGAERPAEALNLAKSLKAEVEKLKDDLSQISDDEKSSIIENLKSEISSSTANELLSDIEKKIEKRNKYDKNAELLERHFANTTGRLREELFSLTKRSNLNLAIGIVTTLVGLSLLGMFVMDSTLDFETASDFAESFVPRLSLVVLIEIFAYFFLRLYKDTLTEIKYFQNEITNLEAKHLATEIALENKIEAGILQSIEGLLATERNHVLNKGQTTVEIEKARTEQQLTESVLSKVTGLLKGSPNK